MTKTIILIDSFFTGTNHHDYDVKFPDFMFYGGQ